jgi:uncharacterized protein (TIGR02301 family)
MIVSTLRKLALAANVLLGLGGLLLTSAPAQAQFFDFPFFRPSRPQIIQVQPRRPDARAAVKRKPKPRVAKKKPPDPATAAVTPAAVDPGAPATPDAGPPETPPPYEPQLLRLAEILGALAHLRNVCGADDAGQWRARMGNLIETEARSAARKAKLAGAYNRGFRGYEMSHRACTPGARGAIARFMDEGEKLTRAIADRYSAS